MAPRSAVIAVGGAKKMYGLASGWGHVPSVERGLQVDHAQLGAREELAHGVAQGRGGIVRQPDADVPGEMDVPTEGQGDGLAIPLPVRVEG